MKTILITGASSGIGKVIALTLANAGHTVYAGVRKQVDFEKMQKIPNVIPLILDVTSQGDIQSAVSTINSKGSLDVLINNAGIALVGATIEMPMDQVRKQLDVNLISQIEVTQAFFEILRENKGLIIITGSVQGLAPLEPWCGPYDMSKFALEAFALSLRKELKKFGIKICIVNPGEYATEISYKYSDMLKTLTEESTNYKEEYQKLYSKLTPEKFGRDPEILGKEILTIVESENPPEEYLSVSDWEQDWVYKKILSRLLKLIQASNNEQDPKDFLLKYLEKEF